MAGCIHFVRWQVTLCDPIWQVTPRSSKMDSHEELYLALTFNLLPGCSPLTCPVDCLPGYLTTGVLSVTATWLANQWLPGCCVICCLSSFCTNSFSVLMLFLGWQEGWPLCNHLQQQCMKVLSCIPGLTWSNCGKYAGWTKIGSSATAYCTDWLVIMIGVCEGWWWWWWCLGPEWSSLPRRSADVTRSWNGWWRSVVWNCVLDLDDH